tara:strand:- start:7177 stop:7701 length:525 start_codon:yes stop_codon:yes gene_type:complete
MFSEVSVSPCRKYAVKSSEHALSDGWLLYAATLLTMDDLPDWALRVYHLRVDLENGTFCALMECLEEGDECLGELPDKILSEIDIDDYEDCDPRGLAMFDFLSTLEALSGVPLVMDCHDANRMARPCGTMVFSDPTAVSKWFRAKDDPEEYYADRFRAYIESCAERAKGRIELV